MREEKYPSGQVKARTCMKQDAERNYKKDGWEVAWYENGQKQGEWLWKDGKEEGTSTVWYENGQEQVEGTFRDGALVPGTKRAWYENGSPVPVK